MAEPVEFENTIALEPAEVKTRAGRTVMVDPAAWLVEDTVRWTSFLTEEKLLRLEATLLQREAEALLSDPSVTLDMVQAAREKYDAADARRTQLRAKAVKLLNPALVRCNTGWTEKDTEALQYEQPDIADPRPTDVAVIGCFFSQPALAHIWLENWQAMMKTRQEPTPTETTETPSVDTTTPTTPAILAPSSPGAGRKRQRVA